MHKDQALAADAIATEWTGQLLEWGKRDCVRMIGAARAKVGARWMLPKYETEAGAWRALKRLGFPDLPTAAAAWLGEELPNPLFAREGDVALFPAEGRWGGGLGMILSNHRILLPAGPEGETARFLPLGHVCSTTGKSLCLRAWRLV